MKKFRMMAGLLAAAMCLSCCPSGYGQAQTVLHVVTESTYRGGLNYVIQDAVNAFSQSHAGVTLEMEILPYEESEREARLETLRREMEQGTGPDLYFLPTRNVVEKPFGTPVKIDPLFKSIPKAMKDGSFYDFSSLYDRDETLNPADFQQVVLDAGCMGEQRYVLPLCFSMNAFYFISDGTSGYRSDMTVMEVMDAVLASKNAPLAAALCGISVYGYQPESIFSELFDSETGEVTLPFEEVAEFFARYQKLQRLADQAEETWEVPFTPKQWREAVLHDGYVSGLFGGMYLSALAQRDGKTLMAIPLRAPNEQVTALVSWYGAIGADCKEPELAYEFLKTMLLPQYQWQTDGSSELRLPGWPVRVKGSVEAVWPSFYQGIEGWPNWRDNPQPDGKDEWVTQVTDEITRCSFRVNTSIARAVEKLKD